MDNHSDSHLSGWYTTMNDCYLCDNPVRWGDKYEEHSVRVTMSYPVICCDHCGFKLDFDLRSQFKMKRTWDNLDKDELLLYMLKGK